jgi:hypothetical protein
MTSGELQARLAQIIMDIDTVTREVARHDLLNAGRLAGASDAVVFVYREQGGK